jgi:sulfide:quinone oxidoreductase
MSGARILILGGGFGGLTVANELLDRTEKEGEFQITVVDRVTNFSMGLSRLWVLAGYREVDVEKSRRGLVNKGIAFIEEEIVQIDVQDKRVRTESDALAYDYLVVALGATPDSSLVPGSADIALNFHEKDDIERLREALSHFERGRIVVFITMPQKCPPAPYEAALIIDEQLRTRKVRESVTMEIHSPKAIALPIAGKEVSSRLGRFLRERDISLVLNSEADTVDPLSRTVSFKNGATASFDLLIGAPPLRPPRVVRESALGDMPGIPVDPFTLETRHSDVFALGDVAAVKLPNGMMLPKAGVFAEREGVVVASNIAARVRGLEATARYDGAGYCLPELSPGKAGRMRGEFFTEPSPTVDLNAPTVEGFEEKVAFERERLERWF